jgi:hypothetical protein
MSRFSALAHVCRVELIVDEIIEYNILQTRKLRQNRGFGLGRRRTLGYFASTSFGRHPLLDALTSSSSSLESRRQPEEILSTFSFSKIYSNGRDTREIFEVWAG